MFYEIEVSVATSGERKKARIEAGSPAEALARARRHGLVPLEGAVPIPIGAKPRSAGSADGGRGKSRAGLVVACGGALLVCVAAAGWWWMGPTGDAQPVAAGSPPGADAPQEPMGMVPAATPPRQNSSAGEDPMVVLIAGKPGAADPREAPAAAATPEPVGAAEPTPPVFAERRPETGADGMYASAEDRALLYAQLSSPFRLDNRKVGMSRDLERLNALTISADSHVAQLAAVQLAMELRARENEQQAAQAMQRTLRDGQLLMVGFIGGSVLDALSGEDNDLERARGMMNSGLFSDEFDRQTREQLLLAESEIVRTRMRDELREKFIPGLGAAWDAEPVRAEAFEPAEFPIHLSVDPSGYCIATIQNKTGAAITNCLITTDMHVDPERFVAAMARKTAFDAPAYLSLELLGVSTRPSAQLEAARAAYMRVDRGEVVFVPSVPPGGSISLGVAEPGAISQVSESVVVWIGCDQGLGAATIPHDQATAQLASPARRPPLPAARQEPTKRTPPARPQQNAPRRSDRPRGR